MTITLESIKAEQSKVNEMIAEFEKQAPSSYYVGAATISLALGERYAGLVLGENGEADYHLVLLPSEAESINWEDAGKWAQERGGVLPNRREQSLLFANLNGEFQSAWYWSGQQHETDSGFAWYQNFYYGDQNSNHKVTHYCRARAVRRLVIL